MRRGWRAVRGAGVRNGDTLPGWLLIEALRQAEDRAAAARARYERLRLFWVRILASVRPARPDPSMRIAG